MEKLCVFCYFPGLNLPFLFEVTKLELSHQSLNICLKIIPLPTKSSIDYKLVFKTASLKRVSY